MVEYQESCAWNAERKVTYTQSESGSQFRRVRKLRGFDFASLVKSAFLPEGYPQSVSADYLSYQTWDTLQAFASSIAGSLSTQAVLKGVGVGDDKATPLAATLTWLTRQGAGMLGQIAFTWQRGTDLDHNCKKWRLFADLLNDVAMCAELSSPAWPSGMLQPVLCSASVARSLVGVAGAATRTAITQHQAKSNNISDVAAKDASQETMVNLVALLVNLVILPWLSENSTAVWTLFAFLTAIHLYCNFRAVKTLCFDTLNKERLLIILDSYLDPWGRGVADGPRSVKDRESIFLGVGLDERFFKVPKMHLGSSFEKLLDNDHVDAALVAEQLEKNGFFVMLGIGETHVLLGDDPKKTNLLKAYFVAFQMSRRPSTSLKEALLEFDDFEVALKVAGWKTNHLHTSTLSWTGSFRRNL